MQESSFWWWLLAVRCAPVLVEARAKGGRRFRAQVGKDVLSSKNRA
jgi:hypothetical protein